MTNINIFEYASRNKFRFPYKGMITTEDLWDLKPSELDVIYKALNKNVEVNRVPSLTCCMNVDDYDLLTKIEIVKYVFETKEKEAEECKNAASKAAKRQHILDLIAQKQEANLQNMSEEDLRKMLEDLD